MKTISMFLAALMKIVRHVDFIPCFHGMFYGQLEIRRKLQVAFLTPYISRSLIKTVTSVCVDKYQYKIWTITYFLNNDTVKSTQSPKGLRYGYQFASSYFGRVSGKEFNCIRRFPHIFIEKLSLKIHALVIKRLLDLIRFICEK